MTGNGLIRDALSFARQAALDYRLRGVPMTDWTVGCVYGELHAASLVGCDEIARTAARNELSFLEARTHGRERYAEPRP